MKRPNALLVLALALALVPGMAACGPDDGAAGDAALPGDTADTLTARQQRARRDSAVANSRLPGAQGVGRAIDASEAAAARNEAMDTLLP